MRTAAIKSVVVIYIFIININHKEFGIFILIRFFGFNIIVLCKVDSSFE